MTPYQVITLLLDGALDRIDQAIGRISSGDVDAAAVLVQKAVGIVGGLRESLDLNSGGDIADNLDALYEYITVRLETITTESPLETLDEVKNLLQEVHDGWSGISASLDT
jgi:flagellar protein FliS